jgi:hypothetical protein
MKSIETTYHGPTNTRGSRISATDGDNRVSVSYDSALSSEENHQKAAMELRTKLEWTGRMIGGHTKAGMVWVFVGGGPEYVIG